MKRFFTLFLPLLLLTSSFAQDWIKTGTEPPKDTRTIGVMINKDNFQQVQKEQGITH